MATTATDPADMDAATLVHAYARRTLSPTEALQAITERTVRHNPRINAFAVLNPGAARQAIESGRRWAAGRPLGPLDGVPVTIKDLIDVAGLPTRRGSRTTPTTAAADDAPAVLGLLGQGAVLFGKTTTTEFGWKSPGDCPLHGITRNPWNTDTSPGGSSSGAAAACAAGFGPLHLGTDAGGSIRIPAAWCGVVGLKPTFGRVPQWPLGAFGHVAAAGPITRTVRDAALMLGALARHDPRDPFCLPDAPHDWTTGLEDGVAGLRVCVLRRPGFDAPVDATGVAAVEEAAQVLADAGATIHDDDPGLPDMGAAFRRVWQAALATLVATMTEAQQAMIDPGLRETAAGALDGAALMAAEADRVLAAHRMAMHHLCYDLILCPTVPCGPPRVDAPLTDAPGLLLTDWAPWTFAFNLTRQPAITVPFGFAGGAPRSVQVAAAMYQDGVALRAARVLEQAMPAGRAPITG